MTFHCPHSRSEDHPHRRPSHRRCWRRRLPVRLHHSRSTADAHPSPLLIPSISHCLNPTLRASPDAESGINECRCLPSSVSYLPYLASPARAQPTCTLQTASIWSTLPRQLRVLGRSSAHLPRIMPWQWYLLGSVRATPTVPRARTTAYSSSSRGTTAHYRAFRRFQRSSILHIARIPLPTALTPSLNITCVELWEPERTRKRLFPFRQVSVENCDYGHATG